MVLQGWADRLGGPFPFLRLGRGEGLQIPPRQHVLTVQDRPVPAFQGFPCHNHEPSPVKHSESFGMLPVSW